MSEKNLQHYFVFESFGVRVRIESNDMDLLAEAESQLRKALIGKLDILSDSSFADFSYGVEVNGSRFVLYEDEKRLSSGENKIHFLRYFDNIVSARVTSNAKGLIFVHAGAVEWRGRAIVLPGSSGKGKTTLVSELIKMGAGYYSDEYAVLDEKGLNHPYARSLVLKVTEGPDMGIREVPPGDLQANVGDRPIPVGMVIFAEFGDISEPVIERLSIGNGILEAINHTLPFSISPENSLNVLKTALSRAIILKGMRGDAKQFARSVLSFFDRELDSGTADRSLMSFFGGDDE